MIINSESRIETVVLNNENCPIFDQSHQISSLPNSPPPETNENHQIILKSIKFEHGEQKFIVLFCDKDLLTPSLLQYLSQLKYEKKLGLRLDPLPPFGPMSQILQFFLFGRHPLHLCKGCQGSC